MRNRYIPIDVEFFLEGSAEDTFETAKKLYTDYIRLRGWKIQLWKRDMEKVGQTALESWN